MTRAMTIPALKAAWKTPLARAESRRPLAGRLALVAAALVAVAVAGLGESAGPVLAAEDEPVIARQEWSFSGILGHYDRAQLRRGMKVYFEVCASCHGMKLLKYRNLGERGGPELSPQEVKKIAAEFEVLDGPNDEGEMFERPAKPADAFKSPYPNDQAARAANGGALPPDLSVIAKARGIPSHALFAPLAWARDILSGYQEGGPDYIYALLTGYRDEPPEGFELAEGMQYNAAFPGHQIAMPPPLSDDLVEYDDGSPQTVDQYARDVAAFLMWAAEPKLEERKLLGIRVFVYLLILAAILYLAKRRLWARVPH